MKHALALRILHLALCISVFATTSFARPQKAVDIKVSGYTGSTLENFPVLVRISPDRIPGFSYADCAAGGADIAFRDSRGNALDREIDTWDPNGESLAWVRVPAFTNAYALTMTYQDAAVTTQPACQTDGSVWSSYAGVWHLGEGFGTASDSTAHGLDGTVDVAYDDSCVGTNAVIGKGRYIPASAYLSLPNFSNLALGNTLTLSGWYKYAPSVDIASSSPMLFYGKTAWNSTSDGWYVCLQWTSNSDTTKKTIGINGAGNSPKSTTIDSIKSAWVHVTAVFNGSTGAVYSNGALKKSQTITAAKELASSLVPTMFTSSYTGFADEVRIRDAVNGADWVKAEYQTVASPNFLSYGVAHAAESIQVTASPGEYGEPCPGYGYHAGHESGTAYVFSCPPTATNDADAVYAVCSGYRLRLADGTEVTGTGNSTNITFSADLEGAVLTWLWETTPRHKVTVANFDEDLATVYINGESVANGEFRSFTVGENVTLELRDFRNDWYFAYAPPSQTDRNLALDYWGGLPEGVASNLNPCVVTVGGALTVTPNIDCKGHVWYAVGTTAISNSVYKMAASGFNATKRILTASTYSAYYAGDKVMDFAMRVRKDGVNYTVTSLGSRGMFKNSGVTAIRVAPRLDTAVFALTDSVGKQLVAFEGLADCAMTAVQGYLLYYDMTISGLMSNHVPRVATSIGDQAYGRRPLTGILPLPVIKTIGSSSFNGCSGITELYSTSPQLTSIGTKAFSGASKMKKVTLASPVLSSVAADAFNYAITNLTYLSAPPASQTPLDNLIAPVAAADGAHTLRVYVPLCTAGWWDLVSEPTAAEVSAGLPEGCYGTFVTGTGARKGWMIATDDVDASLVVTDMSQIGNAGYEIHADLAQGDTLTLSREGFTSCDLQHFNRATGAWETFETKRVASFTYTHDGQLTRARWKVDGFALNVSSDCYGGTFTVSGATPVAGDNVYAAGSVLTIAATGRAEHPTSHFTTWTSGVSGEATNSATITVTMDSDKVLTAAFYPDEWLFDTSTKKITDGEYTSDAAVTLDATAKSVTVGTFSGGQNYSLIIDLSLPVLVPSDPGNAYAVTWLAIGGNTTLRKLRFGPRFGGFNDSTFRGSVVLERLDNLGHTQVKNLPYCFVHDCGSAPLHSQTYEAGDFLPESLVSVGDYFYSGGPYLVGTLRLPNFKTISANGNYLSCFSGRTAGVTNLYLTCETLTTLSPAFFFGMKLQELTIGSTNLTAAASGAFSGAAATLERLNFLAHAPASTALDNILASYNARTTTSAKPLLIYCSKRAPGWRMLKAEVDKTSAEWLSRPEGTWGIYQTAAGKRFYLVQRDSLYDENIHTMIILR